MTCEGKDIEKMSREEMLHHAMFHGDDILIKTLDRNYPMKKLEKESRIFGHFVEIYLDRFGTCIAEDIEFRRKQ